MTLREKSEKIKSIADQLGFSACGIAAAKNLEVDANYLQQWLDNGYAAEMQYMHNHFEMRTNPALLVEDTKSVIVLLYNYYPSTYPFENQSIKISRYALGKDYHKVLKKKLKHFYQRIHDEISPINGRYFVDSAPVLERSWAREAGLGWIGKNSLLLNNRLGSYVFISVILVDLELEYDRPINDYCGNCTRCLDACPTQAIVNPKVVDSNRCISYQTIEKKGNISDDIRKMQNGWIFGCDICQEVCPWNKMALPHNEPEFSISPALANMTSDNWLNLSEETYLNIAESSAIKRAGYLKLKQNIEL